MIRHATPITVASFAAMLFVGVGIAVIGAAARDIGLRPEEIGWLLGAEHLGFAVAVGLAGAAADVRSKAGLLLGGSVALAAAFALLFVWPALVVNLGIMVGVGVGIGIYEAVTDPMLMDLHPARQSRVISLNHAFLSLGALSITVYVLLASLAWRTSMVLSAVIVAGLGLFFALTRLERRPAPAEGTWRRLRSLERRGTLAVLCLATMIAVGIEIGTVGILTTYLAELRGLSNAAAKTALLLFLLGLAGGRVGAGFFLDDRRLERQLLFLTALTVPLSALLYGFDVGPWVHVLAFATGAALSAQVPIALALGGLHYPEAKGLVLGLIKVAIPVGGAVVPLAMSTVTGLGSFRVSLALIPLVALAGLALAAGQRSRLRVGLPGE